MIARAGYSRRLGKVLGVLSVAAVTACSVAVSTPSLTSTAPPTASPAVSASPSPSPSPSPDPFALLNADQVVGWREDLAMMLPAMDHIHPKLDHGTPRDQLDAAVGELSARLPALTADAAMVGVLRIVAMVSARGCDGHTGAFIWGTGSYPVESLPLRLWWFDEGVLIVDALPPYEDLRGARIDTLDGHPMADVLATLDPLIPRDNAATVRLLTPRYLLIPEILRGLGMAGSGPVDLGLTLPDGSTRSASVGPIPMADYNAWAGPYGLHLPANPDVLYLSRIGEALWWERFDDGTLFVQYNRVDVMPTATLDGLTAALHEDGVTRVVLDVRHNYGGQVPAVTAMLERLRDPAVDREGRLFVITGRNTFSAASLFVARLVDETSALVVGEPMGGCPTSYGDSVDVDLPFSGIAVSVPDTLEIAVSADDRRPTIQPDLPARLTPDEWAAGSDPALAAIVATGP